VRDTNGICEGPDLEGLKPVPESQVMGVVVVVVVVAVVVVVVVVKVK